MKIFDKALKAKCGINTADCGSKDGEYIYLDDVIFSGNRVRNDLSEWIKTTAPKEAKVHVIAAAIHTSSEWIFRVPLKKVAEEAKKNITFTQWRVMEIENQKTNRNRSEVLWPAIIPEDAALKAYISQEKKYPFETRTAGGKLEHAIFSSENGRQLLERELLLAGMKIRSFSKQPSDSLRPLGFGSFGLGFGSMIATFRNCPNNSPLALWWGDPKAAATHPFSKWYPLLPRKTYSHDVDFDDIDF